MVKNGEKEKISVYYIGRSFKFLSFVVLYIFHNEINPHINHFLSVLKWGLMESVLFPVKGPTISLFYIDNSKYKNFRYQKSKVLC